MTGGLSRAERPEYISAGGGGSSTAGGDAPAGMGERWVTALVPGVPSAAGWGNGDCVGCIGGGPSLAARLPSGGTTGAAASAAASVTEGSAPAVAVVPYAAFAGTNDAPSSSAITLDRPKGAGSIERSVGTGNGVGSRPRSTMTVCAGMPPRPKSCLSPGWTDRCRLWRQNRRPRRRSTTRPPTTPPAIAPTLEWLLAGAAVSPSAFSASVPTGLRAGGRPSPPASPVGLLEIRPAETVEVVLGGPTLEDLDTTAVTTAVTTEIVPVELRVGENVVLDGDSAAEEGSGTVVWADDGVEVVLDGLGLVSEAAIDCVVELVGTAGVFSRHPAREKVAAATP